jgi:transcription antitermination factor NusG
MFIQLDHAQACAQHGTATPAIDRTTTPPPALFGADHVGDMRGLWDVVQCYAGHEKALAWRITDLARTLGGVVPLCYALPITSVRKCEGQRWRTRHLPVLPGYVFVNSGDVRETRHQLNQGPSGRAILRYVDVPDQVALKRDLSALFTATAQKGARLAEFKDGEPVKILGGPFAGHDGTVDRVGINWVTLNVRMFGRTLSLETSEPVERL